MSPDADKLRQRKNHDVVDAATEPSERLDTLKGLGGTEIVIDGTIYDIADFNHPGGDSIGIFGGKFAIDNISNANIPIQPTGNQLPTIGAELHSGDGSIMSLNFA